MIDVLFPLESYVAVVVCPTAFVVAISFRLSSYSCVVVKPSGSFSLSRRPRASNICVTTPVTPPSSGFVVVWVRVARS